MRLIIARFLTLITLLLWVIVFPLSGLRILGQLPSLYLRGLRDGDIYTKSGQAIALVALRNIPQDSWSPWINRHPIVIQNVFHRAVNQQTFEELVPDYFICWVNWWLGAQQQPCLLAQALVTAIDPSRWESIRAYLWETLPLCTTSSSTACLPADTTDYAVQGRLQSKWWESYRIEFLDAATHTEVEFVSDLTHPPPRLLVLNWTLSATLFLTILALILSESGNRGLYMSSVFFVIGGSALAAGGVLVFGLVRFDLVRLLLDFQELDGIDILLPQIWSALTYLLGISFICVGCIAIVPGLCGLSLLTTRRVLRLSLPVSSVILLLYAYSLFHETAFMQPHALPVDAPHATPTAWPTLTPTLLPTPTPTLTPLPLTAGTPLPVNKGRWWESPEILRCTSIGDGSIEAIKVVTDTLWVIQEGMVKGFTFSETELILVQKLPRLYDQLTFSPSGHLAGITQGRDVWLFALPEWSQIFGSRISTLNPVASLVILPDETYLAMGLDNGYLWVNDVRTGKLVTLLRVSTSVITSLAPHHMDGFIFTGAENGLVEIVDFANLKSITSFSGHSEAVTAIMPFPDEDVVVTLDKGNRFIIWEVSSGHVLRERTLANVVTSNLLAIEDLDSESQNARAANRSIIVGGTMDGQVFQLDAGLVYKRLSKLGSPITAIADEGGDYLSIGTADGQYCVVASLQ